MDKKNVIIFILVGIFILLYHPFILPNLPESWQPPKPVPAEQQTTSSSTSGNTNTPAPSTAESTATSPAITTTETTIKTAANDTSKTIEPKAVPVKEVIPEEKFIVETQLFKIHFSNRGGIIEQLFLKKFRPEVDSEEPLALIYHDSFKGSPSLPNMKVERRTEGSKQIITFRDGNFRRVFEIEDNDYAFQFRVSGGTQQKTEILSLHSLEPAGMGMLMGDRMWGALYSIKGSETNDEIFPTPAVAESNINISADGTKLDYFGFRNKYFTCLIEPDVKNSEQFITVNGSEELSHLSVSAQTQDPQRYTVYIGPVDDNFKDRDPVKFKEFFNYFGFDFIIHFLLNLLKMFSSIPGVNMGFAIILLTIFVRIVLFPLNLKAQTSMFMMSKIGPEMKKLQEKFKNDRQQLGLEQMKLFRENGVNPLAGCLPMLIQMPVFISLFTAIGDGFILRHAPFIFWIKDVSAPDALMTFDFSIPIIGSFVSNINDTTHFNFLVVLYVITMYIQQSMMPKSTDPQQAQMQKSMKIVMFMFAFLLYNYSSGLMLYFVGSNTLSMLESWYIKKKVIPRMEAKKNKKNKSK